MPEEDYEFTPASRLMQHDEILAIAKVFVAEGVNKIRLTGGEPLVRKDAARIIASLAELPVTLTLTTNGTRLHEFLPVLNEGKIKSLNISLDTLQADKFNLLTRRNQFQQVFDNIHLMIDNGYHVKVNVVVMKGLNDTEINDFIAWTKDTPVHVRFIEFMPFSGNRWTSNKVFTWQQILEVIEDSDTGSKKKSVETVALPEEEVAPPPAPATRTAAPPTAEPSTPQVTTKLVRVTQWNRKALRGGGTDK
jgi:cyclic pyranopterin phosphate synthase